jgi:hypothetical protein
MEPAMEEAGSIVFSLIKENLSNNPIQNEVSVLKH